MSQCDDDKMSDPGEKCLTLEDISAAGVSSAAEGSKLKDFLLLRKDLLPVCHDSSDFTEDNASLEANFGDESSCCVSDVSSLSFQNAVLDDPEYNSAYSSQAAGERSSAGSEYVGNDLQDGSELSENVSEMPDETLEIFDEVPEKGDVGEATEDLGRDQGQIRDVGCDESVQKHPRCSKSCDLAGDKDKTADRCCDNITVETSIVSGSQEFRSAEHSTSPRKTEAGEEVTKKDCVREKGGRNSEQISSAKSQQLLKSSPGLARRMLSGEGKTMPSIRQSSGSPLGQQQNDRVVDSENLSNDGAKGGVEDQEEQLEDQKEGSSGDVSDVQEVRSKDYEEKLKDQEKRQKIAHMDALYKRQIEALMQNQLEDESVESSGSATAKDNIENEYNYVKCTRIQDKEVYFGMQLAHDSDPHGVGSRLSSLPDHSSDGKRPTSGTSLVGKHLPKEVAEPGEQKLSDVAELSLDTTQVNSGDKSIPCHMPSVEDGLSSGHASDCEENVPSRRDSSPADTLRSCQMGKVLSRPDSLPSSLVSEKDGDIPATVPDQSSRTRQRDVEQAIQDIKSAIEKSKKVKLISPSATNDEQIKQVSEKGQEPVWITRKEQAKDLPQQLPKNLNKTTSNDSTKNQKAAETDEDEDDEQTKPREHAAGSKPHAPTKEYSTDEETDELLNKQYIRSEKVDIPELYSSPVSQSQSERRQNRAREVALRDPMNETVLIEGVLFRANYLGSTQLISEGQPSKGMRMMQAQEAVGRIKAPEGETQPSTEVDLFVSVEKIMVLNTDLQEIMMDHALRTISYIADIGDILVIMARRGPIMNPSSDGSTRRRGQTKICCHVFESDEAQLIAQSIGQAFQVSYMEFLKANGIDNPSHIRELDYQEVLNQQEIFGEELYLFSNREMQKEVIVPKVKGEPLGVVIVESGWGSMVPTVVLANMSPTGAAARCGQLNIGDQIMSINGISLVGLPLSTCQNYIKVARHQSVVKLVVVSCPPVVEVLIKRPDIKYQLGFSVQNGVICSLLRGGIAERGGIRVGHRIIEINGQSVVAISHDKIVHMLATSVGEIQMKTMPTSIFRLLTGQDVPHYI